MKANENKFPPTRLSGLKTGSVNSRRLWRHISITAANWTDFWWRGIATKRALPGCRLILLLLSALVMQLAQMSGRNTGKSSPAKKPLAAYKIT
ncbi:MAG: hypothetical protein GPOALKHO_000208 [Sodalis sp.]|nr:MAG: hypothetical protein GPOALKHO_000208 [Sodalis sp.]